MQHVNLTLRALTVALLSGVALQAALTQSPDVVMREATVPVNGIRLHYRVGGSGPPLLLLHGFTGIGADWAPFIPALARTNMIVAPDLRGHGGSTNPTARFDHREAARDILALLDQLGLKDVRGVGYSSGANVLLQMCLLRPGALSAVVALNGAHRVAPSAREKLAAYPAFEALSEGERSTYLRRHPGGEVQVRQILAQLRAVGSVPEDVEITTQRLSTIRTPILVLAGDRDELYPLEVTYELYRSLPVAQFWVVPGQGHNLLWAEWGGSPWAIRAFPEVIMDFFAKAER